ncbi:MAG: PHP domain-containing protein [Halanaerobiales bacterium]|nr:PHP domain-containing protein [Halanaerobiales bacterium]
MFCDVDFHIHTRFSDGEGTIKEVLSMAEKCGLRAIAITDHFDPHDELQLKQGIIELKKHIQNIREQAALCKVKVFAGIETSVPININEEIDEMLDFIIRSVHSFPSGIDFSDFSLYDSGLWNIFKDEVLKLIQTPYTDIAGHIMGYFPWPAEWVKGLSFAERRELERKVRERFFDEEWQEQVIQQAIENNVAIEIHNPTSAPDIEFVKKAISRGVRFSLGSDTHLLDWVGKIDYGRGIFLKLGLTENNLFWPGDD